MTSPGSDAIALAQRTALARRAKTLEVVETRLAFARVHLTHNGRQLEFTTRPYLRELLNEPGLVEEDIQKAVKPGVTEMLVVNELAAAACGLDVMIAFPTGPVADRYAKNRVNRPLRRVAAYAELREAAPQELDSVTFKAFGQGTLNVVSAETKKSFREAPADWLVIEEFDECDQANLEFAYGRLADSDFKALTRVANPTYPDTGINRFYKQGTQRQWHIRCRNRECGEAQPLDWFVNAVRAVRDRDGQVEDYELRDSEWEPSSGRDIRLFCRKCGEGLDRLERDPDYAFWRDTNPGAARRSRHFNQLPLPNRLISIMWEEFRAGLDDEDAMLAFYTDVLGLPYSAAGSRLTSEILERCVQKYILPDSGSCCAAGLDLGGRHKLVIFDSPAEGVARLVFAGECRNVPEVKRVLADFDVRRMVADMLPEKEKMHDLQGELGFASDGMWLLWLCLFGGERSLTTWRYASSLDDETRAELGLEGEDAANVIRCDRTWLLSYDMRLYVKRKTWLPRDAKSLCGGDFYEELCAIEKVLKVAPDGTRRYAWTKGKDHYRLASAYARLACNMMGFDRPRVASGITVTAPAVEGEFTL